MTDRELRDFFERIENSYARIEAALARLVPEPKLNRADRVVLIRLLPVLFAAFGAEAFAAKDVLDLPEARLIYQGRSSSSFGKLFARASGVFINGMRIERFGVENHAVLWRVETFGAFGARDAINAA